MINSKNTKKEFSLTDEKSVKRKANNEEKKASKEIGGFLTPNSGSTPFLKGDFFSGKNMIDMKSTESEQFIITTQILSKLIDDAFVCKKEPVLMINFTKTKKLQKKKWLVIPYGS